MSKVSIDRQKIDILANAISDKSGVPVTMTLDEMVEAVDGIDTSGITPTGNIDISSAGVTDVTNYATATVAEAIPSIQIADSYYNTLSNTRKWNVRAKVVIDSNDENPSGYIDDGTYYGSYQIYSAVPSGTTITPSTSSQTVGGANYMMEGAITVAAMPSGTAGTPTATKGTVSNHQVSITPSVTNTSGYISGGTINGTAVTVSASELVSGTYSVTSAGTKDVTNYASASVPSGTEGTPTATKGTASNHSISVTPSVTNTGGYITGSTKTGTAVTVSASELASGNKAITQNGTNIDVVGYSTVSVDVPSSGGVTVTDVANTTGTTCVITTGSAPSEDIPLNTQLIDYTAVKNGYIVDGDTGEETVSQWSSCSDFTLIDHTMTFSYIGYEWYNLVFYDTSKNYISSIYMHDDADSVTNNYAHGTLTPAKIPSTAKYVRIDSYPTNPSSTQLSLIRTA